MKTVSTAYTESMASVLRNRSYVRIKFQNVNAAASTDGVWVSNGEMDYSNKKTLDYDYEYSSDRYATLELNRWLLNGSFHIIPEDREISDQGYVSSQISDADGSFEEKPTLTREFSTPHNLLGMTFTFDTRNQEWPTSITLTLYNNNAVVYNQTHTVTDVQIVIPTETMEVDKVQLTFDSVLPYRRARLEQVLYGIIKTFGNDELVSEKQSHDIDPLTRRLPQEKFQFVVLDFEHEYDPDNPEGIYEFIDVNAPVAIQYGYELDDGSIEWLKADNYKLNGKPSVKNEQVTFTATGLIGSLTDTYYKSKIGTKSLYDMAVDVLEDANLTPTTKGENPWTVDESLKTMYTNAVLPIDTHMNCLQLIAHAARCKLYTDDDNIIHISPFSVAGLRRDSGFVLDFDGALEQGGPSVTKIEQLKAVTVAKYSYAVDGEASEIYKGETSETTAHIEFSGLAQNVNISVSGGTLVSSAIYGRAADLVLSAGTKTIIVTGSTLQESSIVYTYPVKIEGETDEEKNPLITSDSMASALAAHVIEYLQYRNTYDAQYRGNPEFETGDVIGLQTKYTDEMDALILTDEITFNGALSGKMKVKGLI